LKPNQTDAETSDDSKLELTQRAENNITKALQLAQKQDRFKPRNGTGCHNKWNSDDRPSPCRLKEPERLHISNRISRCRPDRIHSHIIHDTRAQSREDRLHRRLQPTTMGRNSRGRIGYTIRGLPERKDCPSEARILPPQIRGSGIRKIDL